MIILLTCFPCPSKMPGKSLARFGMKLALHHPQPLAGVLHLRRAPSVLPPASQIVGDARRSVTAPGLGAPRLPPAGAGRLPGAGELRPPRLRAVMPGLGAGAPPPSPCTRSLPPSSPPQALSQPQPGWLRTADSCRPPHSRRRPRSSASPPIPEHSRCFPGTLD